MSLSDRDRLQLELYGLHSQSKKDDARHLAEIRADVAHRFAATLAWIDSLKASPMPSH